MPDMDEPVNVDMEPEEALRILLGEEHRDEDEAAENDTEDA
jgi:hypothetical protein